MKEDIIDVQLVECSQHSAEEALVAEPDHMKMVPVQGL